LLLALCAAGCGGNANIAMGSAGSAAGFSVEGSSTTVSSVLTLLLLINASLLGDQVGPVTFEPPMDASRRVVERDCTQPIEDWSANLRCR